MKRNELDREFTRIVAEMLAKGFQITTSSMNGTQGELAKVDLTDGSEIYRVYLHRESDFRYNLRYHNNIVLTVGKIPADKVPHRNWDATIWLRDLETVFESTWVEIAPDWFVDEVEAQRIETIASARRAVLQERQYWYDCPDAFKSVALRWLKRTQRGFKSTKVDEIQVVGRVYTPFGIRLPVAATHTACYEIRAKGKKFTLRGRS